MATSAIPVLFPPQRINSHRYADAGVRESVFLTALATSVTRLRARGIAAHVNVYLIVNGDLTLRKGNPDKTGILGIGERSFTIVTDENLRQSVLEIIRTSERNGWTLHALVAPELPKQFLPSQSDPANEPLFSPKVTKFLFDEGKKMTMETPIPWLSAKDLSQRVKNY